MDYREYGDESIDKVLRMSPENRVQDSGDNLDNKICGILIGFKTILDARGGWVDIITTRYAKKEIMELIEGEVQKRLKEERSK